MAFLNLALPLFKLLSLQRAFNYKNIAKKIVLYTIALILFITFYVFGCITFYYFLLPYWGETLAAFSLALLSLIFSLSLILIANRLKIKKKQTPPLLNLPLENTINQDLHKIVKETSPKVIMAVFGAIFLATFLVCRGKKQNKT